MKKTLAVGCLVLLSGCAGAVPWNPQGYAGLNIVRAEFQVPEGKSGPTSLEVIGGKEQEAISFEAELPDGTKTKYSASGVKAFDGQAVRAEVEAAVSEDAKEAMPGIVDAVIQALERVAK